MNSIKLLNSIELFSTLKLLLEVGEKEALLRKFSKQSRTVNKMKRGESTEYILQLINTYRTTD